MSILELPASPDRRSRVFARACMILCLAAALGVTACSSSRQPETATDEQALSQQNKKASELMRLGNNLRQQGNLIDATEMYRRAADADPHSPLPPAALGDTLRQLKRYEEADQVYRAALERSPFSGLALQGYGILMIETGQPDAAIERCGLVEPFAARAHQHADSESESSEDARPDAPAAP